MKFTKSFKIAWNILLHSKLRSWLTILGIVIGIAAVVSIISISEGAQQSLQNQLGTLGADILTVTPGYSQARGAGGGFRGPGEAGGFGGAGSATSNTKNLTAKDVMAIKTIPNVKYVMGQISERLSVTYSSKSTSLNLVGVDENVWKDITTETIASGRFLSNGDSYSVVLGGNIVTSTFPAGIPLNSKIIIAGKSFNVVGILTSGSTIYMPIDVARTTFDNVDSKSFSSISIKIADVSLTEETVNATIKKLMLSRGIINDKSRDFSVSDPAALRATFQQTMSMMALFLGAIAAISLLVGAIGIANSMFTSVLEKTRDIGILKAIGAKNRDILTIFLLNSGMIGLVGGIGGIILGIMGSSYISYLSSSATGTTGAGGGITGRLFSTSAVNPQLIIGALLIAVVIGMIAGAIPAYRASRLKPVDALRYE